MTDETTREDQIGKILAKGFSKRSENRPKFTLEKHGVGAEIPSAQAPPSASIPPQPIKITEEEKAKALLDAQNIIKSRLGVFTKPNAVAIVQGEENTDFTRKLVNSAKQRIKLEKIAGEHEGEAISMDGSDKDTSGLGGEKSETQPGGRVWATGIDAIGDPEKNSPNRSFEISRIDESQDTTGVVNTSAPKSPVNKPLPKTERRGVKQYDYDYSTGDSPVYGNNVSPEESATDQYGTVPSDNKQTADNSDVSNIESDLNDLADIESLLLSLRNRWSTKAPLRGTFKDISLPPEQLPDALPRSGLPTVGDKKPVEAKPPTLVPPLAALRHPGKIPMRQEEPLSVEQLTSHKAKKDK